MTGKRPFTLLELLVATIAGAVLMAALMAAMSGAWRLQQRAAELESGDVPREAAHQRLRREFLATVPPVGILAGPLISEAVKAGEWRHDEVQWTAAVGATAPDAAEGDLVTVHYYLTDSEQAGVFRLVRTEQRNALVVEQTPPEEVVVLEDVVSFSLTWYDGQLWQDGWDSTAEQNQLPQAVHVRLDFAARGQIRPPPLELIVPFQMRTLSAQNSGGGT